MTRYFWRLESECKWGPGLVGGVPVQWVGPCPAGKSSTFL